MKNSHSTNRRHGLSLVQWGLLITAFVIGVGSTFVVREFFPPAHAGVIRAASSNSDPTR